MYLSRYIIKNKTSYYKALQGVTEKNDWATWILYMLDAVEKTAQETLNSIKDIYSAQNELLNFLSRKAPSLCSKELVELLFEQPYCKISFLVERNIAKSQTASKYLKQLCNLGIFQMLKHGRDNYYINIKLWDILTKNSL